MKRINEDEAVKVLLLVSFLVTVFLALVAATIFKGNPLIAELHKFSGIIFSIFAVFHIIANSKKYKKKL